MTAITASASFLATRFNTLKSACRKALAAQPVPAWTEYLRDCNKR